MAKTQRYVYEVERHNGDKESVTIRVSEDEIPCLLYKGKEYNFERVVRALIYLRKQNEKRSEHYYKAKND